MSVFSGILGHEPALNLLERGLTHPAPAYLFYGPSGLGKRFVAEQFVHALLGLEKGSSLSAHPDFILLEREAEARDITVEQVRHFLARLHLTSAHGGRIVALIDHAERLSDEAANALLKDVEEPPAAVHVILSSSSFEALPATLRSRMAPIRFERVARGPLVAWLKERGASADQAELVARLSRGAPGKALEMLGDPDSLIHHEQDMAALCKTLTKGSLAQALSAIEAATKSIEAEDDTVAAWQTFLARLTQHMGATFLDDPLASSRVALGLCLASRLVGSGASPRLALEWSAVSPYLMRDKRLPTMLQPFTLFT